MGNVFHQEKEWLEKQPGMNPWEEGCRSLDELLGRQVTAYTSEICQTVVTHQHPHWKSYFRRLRWCLLYHWRDAAGKIDGGVAAQEVVERLREGKGYRGGGELGGNPLRDVVLARAMRYHDERAVKLFRSEYFEFCCGMAGRLDPGLAEREELWWSDLLDHLMGTLKPPGSLKKFDGRSALRNWLGTVLIRFLRRWQEKEDKCLQIEPEKFNGKKNEAFAGVVDERELPYHYVIANIVRHAVRSLSNDECLLLYFLYVEELSQVEVAGIFGIHPGNVSRKRQRALENLLSSVESIAKLASDDEASESDRPKTEHELGSRARADVPSLMKILGQIKTGRAVFAKAICDALEQTVESRGARRGENPADAGRETICEGGLDTES